MVKSGRTARNNEGYDAFIRSLGADEMDSVVANLVSQLANPENIRKIAPDAEIEGFDIDIQGINNALLGGQGEKGLFIAMPSRKAADGEYRDIAHPINSETREQIQKLILEKYQETVVAEEE